jgi:diadenosine tetraphosphate (Ap4A) HIT family hydrolase
MTFTLAKAFIETSLPLCDLALCEARLQDDARYPWIVLIPRRRDLREIEDLSVAERAQLLEEAVACGPAVRAVGAALGLGVEKLNMGALGNVTAQLHVHVVGRRASDPAWPGPVWGHSGAIPLTLAQQGAALAAALKALDRLTVNRGA